MKKKYFLLSLTILAGLSLSSCSLIKSYSSRKPSDSSSRVSLRDDSDTSSSSSRDKKTSKTTGTQRVGSDDYGYISIPDNWIKFTDLDGGDSIQYTDGSAYNIVTMNGYTREKAHVQDGETFNAELIAQRLAYSWNDNKDVEKMWGAKSTVSGNEAFQLNVIMKSGQLVVSWVFQKDDKVYLISFEGDRKTLASVISYIEETWSLDEKGPTNNI
ncbi:hypothetical protein D8796_06145 [Streptococcus cristatus]|uniref:Lipoprotein n=2 Tax=Streptococcus cristatus TaxID=45634 RepID=A0A3R9M153_STRCR|nr:hypothetical protein D8796_06145 [Streptococcus cristatus]RSJ81651.1 hypothetical protein D8795_00160 [Streptococcus cristatus]RSJ84693.1 hypothetical protein D8794_08655 [Streptococcus cristatus]RSJ86717.1 hypothetical protein D8793_02565 [Streptococcus cristatus]